MARPPLSRRNVLRLGGASIVGISSLGGAGRFALPAAVAADRPTRPEGAVSVRDHGAVGDGVADDLAAIVAAVAAGGGGRTVWFPPGTYRITGSIDVADRADVHLLGAGADQARIVVDSPLHAAACRFTRCLRPSLRHLGIRSSWVGDARGGDPLVDLVGCRGFEVAHLEVRDHSTFGISARNWSVDGRIHDNVVRGLLADGIHVQVASARVVIDGNDVADTGDDAIGVTGDGNRPCRDVTVVDNVVRRSGGAGVAVYGGANIVVARNAVDGTFQAGVLVTGEYAPVVGVVVDGNEIVGAGEHTDGPHIGVTGVPAGVSVIAPPAFPVEGVVVRGNVVRRGRNNFVRIGNQASNLIGDVVVEGNDCAGPLLPGGAGGGSESNNRFAGIYVQQARSARITDNRVAEAYHESIHVLGRSSTSGVEGAVRILRNACADANPEAVGAVSGIKVASGSFVEVAANAVVDPLRRLLYAIDYSGAASGGDVAIEGNDTGGRPCWP